MEQSFLAKAAWNGPILSVPTAIADRSGIQSQKQPMLDWLVCHFSSHIGFRDALLRVQTSGDPSGITRIPFHAGHNLRANVHQKSTQAIHVSFNALQQSKYFSL